MKLLVGFTTMYFFFFFIRITLFQLVQMHRYFHAVFKKMQIFKINSNLNRTYFFFLFINFVKNVTL